MAYQRLNKVVQIQNPGSRLENTQSIKVRLSNHATFTELNWDFDNTENLNWKTLYSKIISNNEYQFIHLNHNSFPLNGNRGPYKVDFDCYKNFNSINLEFFSNSIKNILHKEHWLQPPIDTSKVDILFHRAEELIRGAKAIYMLDQKFHKPCKPYENEWSHAYLEYYEYILITNNKIFIWNLIYE